MQTIFYRNTKAPVLEQLTTTRKGDWLHVVEPSEQELLALSDNYGLDPDLLRDATDPYEAPRIEKENGAVYVFTRYCYFEEGGSLSTTQPLLIIYTPDHVITIQHKDLPVLARLQQAHGDVATTQKTKTLLQILEEVNVSYQRRIYRISKQILGIRNTMNKSEVRNEDFIEFINLEEELNEELSALQAQNVMFRTLLSGRNVKLYEEDEDLVEDLALDTAELIELAKSRLKTISNTREAYATIMANTLNKTFKRLTSISIFMTIPTITTGLYGMNLALPLQHRPNAFWFVLLIVMGFTTLAIWIFQRKKWL